MHYSYHHAGYGSNTRLLQQTSTTAAEQNQAELNRAASWRHLGGWNPPADGMMSESPTAFSFRGGCKQGSHSMENLTHFPRIIQTTHQHQQQPQRQPAVSSPFFSIPSSAVSKPSPPVKMTLQQSSSSYQQQQQLQQQQHFSSSSSLLDQNQHRSSESSTNNVSTAAAAGNSSSNNGGPLHRQPSLTGAQRKIRQRREEKLLQNSKLYLASLTKPPAPQLQPSHQSSSSSLSSLAENSFNSSRNGNGGSSAVGSTQFPPSIFHHLPPPPPSNPFPYVNLNASSHLQSSKNAVVEQQPVDDDLLEYRNLIERRGYRSILENNNNDTTNEEKEDNKSPLSNNALSHQFSSMMMNSPSATSLSQTPLPLKTTQQASSSSPLSPTKDKPVRPPRTFEYTVGSTKMPAVSGPKETAVNDNDFAMKQAIHKNPQPPQKFIVPSPPQIVQKPIIQVHPLPPPRHNSLGSSSSSSDSPPSTLLKKPPPVPKKPTSLMNIDRQQQQQQQFYSLDDPTPGFVLNDFSTESSPPEGFRNKLLSMPSHPSPPLPNEHAPPKVKKFSLREKENLPQSTVDKGTYFSSSAALSLASSLQKSFSEEAERKSPTTQGPLPITRANIHKKAHSNAKKTAALELTSTSLPFFHNSLFSSSSSLSSLQNSLNNAVYNPDQHTKEQLRELETRRIQSIESLSKKVAEREVDREAIREELESIAHIRKEIYSQIDDFPFLRQIELHISQLEQLSELNVYLQSQIEKLDQMKPLSLTMSDSERDLFEWRRLRLMQQLNDLQSIQEIFEERGQRLDEILERTLQNKSMVQEWKLYKELLRKLTNERRQIEERLQNVKAQLHALQSTIIVADS